MNKVYLIFDYFKEAFHTNRNNKILYKPQIILVIIKALIMLGGGFFILNWRGSKEVLFGLLNRGWDIEELLLKIFGIALLAFLVIITLLIVSKILEAGLYNMYKNSIFSEGTRIEDFWEGIRKYFLKFLAADILLVLFWIVAFVPFLFIGMITLTIGLTIIPIVISIFLTMWKVSIVMNDYGIKEALKDSINFARNNFFPLLTLQMIHWSFTVTNGGSNAGRISDLFDKEKNIPFGKILPAKDEVIEKIVKSIKIGFVIIIPTITVAYAFSALAVMIVEVFFSLALFIAYKNKFETEVIEVMDPNGEVLE